MKLPTSNKRGLTKRVFVTLVLTAVILWIWAGDAVLAQPFCIFRRLTGVPCWGCGTVSVMQLLMHGKVIDALMLNPLSVVACFMVVAGMVIWWVDYFRHTHVLSSLSRKKLHPLIIVALVVIVLLNWIWNIQKGL